MLNDPIGPHKRGTAMHEQMRTALLQIMNEAGLQIDDTIRHLHERTTHGGRELIEECMKSVSVSGNQTIFALLDAIRPGIGELRKHKRLKTRVRCVVIDRTSLQPSDGTILEISVGGCRLETDPTLTVGTEITLQIDPSPDAGPIVVEHAVVRWAYGRHMGIEFTKIRPEDTSRLRELLDQTAQWQ